MEPALENLVHSKCENDTHIVCSICHTHYPHDVKGQLAAGVIKMRKPFLNGNFRNNLENSKTHRYSVRNKKYAEMKMQRRKDPMTPLCMLIL